ncbi:hypothetical protein ABXN37_05785 [Piscinibacter sakaiensis]|uniref:Uncharacterized protein n=1 Tax=Piscinibacter sakaiensis TaxID=1547922 RepID=A0A0K8NW96_PISS1|nr:hypothetical protein [Piscinibacter sakaiensis]GAP34657.1 hypothetical protein ISF6_5365 [Piscinibacter sakaiensis]
MLDRPILVDVVPLRRLGVRRPDAELRAAAPVRGRLVLEDVRGQPIRRWAGPEVARLSAPGSAVYLLPCLDSAVIVRRRGREIVIAGTEEVELPGRRLATYRQAWWCRPAPATVDPRSLGRPGDVD